MSNGDWRVEKAEEYEDLYKRIRDDDGALSNDLRQWSMVIGFYSALHYCSAVLSEIYSANDFNRHRNRNGLLSKKYRDLWKHYKLLYDLSQQVRYQKDSLTADELDESFQHFQILARKCRRKLGIRG